MTEKIGEFLVEVGIMTAQQVDHVLRLQAEGDTRIFGEIAIALRYINDDAIRRYVDEAEKQRARLEELEEPEAERPSH